MAEAKRGYHSDSDEEDQEDQEVAAELIQGNETATAVPQPSAVGSGLKRGVDGSLPTIVVKPKKQKGTAWSQFGGKPVRSCSLFDRYVLMRSGHRASRPRQIPLLIRQIQPTTPIFQQVMAPARVMTKKARSSRGTASMALARQVERTTTRIRRRTVTRASKHGQKRQSMNRKGSRRHRIWTISWLLAYRLLVRTLVVPLTASTEDRWARTWRHSSLRACSLDHRRQQRRRSRP